MCQGDTIYTVFSFSKERNLAETIPKIVLKQDKGSTLENAKFNMSVYAPPLWIISLILPYIFSAVLASASKRAGSATKMHQSCIRTGIWQEESCLVWCRGGKVLEKKALWSRQRTSAWENRILSLPFNKGSVTWSMSLRLVFFKKKPTTQELFQFLGIHHKIYLESN